MIGVRPRPDQPDEIFIGIPPGVPLVVPGNTTVSYAGKALSSHGESLFGTYTEVLFKQWHRKGGINRELKDEISTVPGWQIDVGRVPALNENGQMLVRGTRQNGGNYEYALWLVTPLHR